MPTNPQRREDLLGDLLELYIEYASVGPYPRGVLVHGRVVAQDLSGSIQKAIRFYRSYYDCEPTVALVAEARLPALMEAVQGLQLAAAWGPMPGLNYLYVGRALKPEVPSDQPA